MPWKYSFGFKLSVEGRNRIIKALVSLGYEIVDVGWDYIIVNKQLTSTDKSNLRDNILKILFWESEV